ncbi:nickel-responsive transcriptional regulator NikR [Candidatus Bathyarchaeota archaeon]|nr:MAG: nickel-responsive transcriptional regulator NikR [Candidatus Bathyarchaeota archaeon]
MAKTVRFSISISPDLLERFDQAIRERAYKNRSKAIRDLIVNFIVEREWEKSEREVMGSLTILYNHDVRGLIEKLLDIQHDHRENIISTMHTHIDEHNCMEILALRGYPSEIKKIADKILSCKGVKHGRLVMSITGEEIT